MNRSEPIIHLEINGKHYHYGSLAAIFDQFTAEDIGMSLKDLYRNQKFKMTGHIKTAKCRIARVEVKRKKQGK